MDVSQLVQQKLSECRLEQRDLADAAEVTESLYFAVIEPEDNARLLRIGSRIPGLGRVQHNPRKAASLFWNLRDPLHFRRK